nr:putative reverse transcriptase domain-containing protein [Tanacetum cinerariifolium]
MLKGCHVSLAHVTTKKTKDKSEGKRLEDVPIVRDFLKVFPEDLTGLPSTRQVEFQINLISGVAPVARAPDRYVGPFKVLEKVGSVAYKLEFPQELSRVHNTFHVSNLQKCYANKPLFVLLDGLHINDKLYFVEEPIEVMDQEVKRLKQSCIPIIKFRWNSMRGPEFTWECEDQFRKKYPHLFTKTASSSSAALKP